MSNLNTRTYRVSRTLEIWDEVEVEVPFDFDEDAVIEAAYDTIGWKVVAQSLREIEVEEV